MRPVVGLWVLLCAASASARRDGGVRLQSVPFIHIPKTSGTSVEKIMLAHGYGAGRYAFESMRGLPPYRTLRNKCSAWHRVPESFVPDSFCVLRDPYDRIVSEFRYEHRRRSGSGSCSCSSLYSWMKDKMRRLASDPEASDCHFIPQSVYAEKCQDILMYNVSVAEYIRERFGIEGFGDEKDNISTICPRLHTTVTRGGNCLRTKTEIESIYHKDFELVRSLSTGDNP